jgi:hypothetical protein
MASVASSLRIRYRERMEVHFTPEQEAQIAQLAIKTGTDAEGLVKDTVLRLLGDEKGLRTPAPELPRWNLGVIGSMHRRDLYDDLLC